MTAKYNRRAMMIKAHAETKRILAHPAFTGRSYAAIFAQQLSRAWGDAKYVVKAAARAAAISPAQRIRGAIVALESKDRWTRADYAARDALATDLRAVA